MSTKLVAAIINKETNEQVDFIKSREGCNKYDGKKISI